MSSPAKLQPKLVDVNVQLPQHLFLALQKSQRNVARYLKQQAALNQYQAGELSFGQAAALAEMPKADFLHFLSQHDVSSFRYSPEELEGEVSQI